jgi:hypothetical protein
MCARPQLADFEVTEQKKKQEKPGDDVARHNRVVCIRHACEAQVADFEVAVGVDEEIVGL